MAMKLKFLESNQREIYLSSSRAIWQRKLISSPTLKNIGGKDVWINKRRVIEESFQLLLNDAAPIQAQQEEFAYEGLFDQQKQKDKSPTKLKGSRMDLSNFINPLNR